MRFIKTIIIFILGVVVGSFFPGPSKQALIKAKNFVFSREQPTEETVFTPQIEPKAKIVRVQKQEKARTIAPKRVAKPEVQQKPTTAKIYTVQVASFKDLKQANSMVNKLIREEYNAYIAPTDIEKRSGWYRVCIGESVNLEQAKQHFSNIKPKFKDSFIQAF